VSIGVLKYATSAFLIMPNSIDRARLVVIMGGLVWLAGWGLVLAFPQFPDGDQTARQQFISWYGTGWLYQVRHAWWWNLAGAVLAWGLVNFLFENRPKRIFAIVGLLIVGVWGYGQTIGWQGELFLASDTPTRLADSQTFIAFERFTIPPAPDGAGRALEMEILVNGKPYIISEANPYRGGGWTVRPRWYGAVVHHPSLDEPLYVGATGSHSVRLNNGQNVTLQVNVETLTVTSDPPLSDWTIDYYAIVIATYPY
jgi:hypothetical protein